MTSEEPKLNAEETPDVSPTEKHGSEKVTEEDSIFNAEALITEVIFLHELVVVQGEPVTQTRAGSRCHFFFFPRLLWWGCAAPAPAIPANLEPLAGLEPAIQCGHL